MGQIIEFRKREATPVTPPPAPAPVAANVNVAHGMTTKSNGKEVFNYQSLLRRAMQSVVGAVLSDVATNGLPNGAVLAIAINTTAKGVEMADWLRAKYPEEITIIIEHEWRDLSASETDFTVTLSFSDTPETLTVPYDAITTFYDEGAKFGLRLSESPVSRKENA